MPHFRHAGVQSDEVQTHVSYAPGGAAPSSRAPPSDRRQEPLRRASTSGFAGGAKQHAASSAGPSVMAQSVGYRLLKQAGWSEGQGLGAKEQGRTEPLLPTLQKGNLGLGFRTNDLVEQQKQQPPRRKRPRDLEPPGPSESREQQQQQQQQQRRQLHGSASKAVAALVEAELAAESIEVKVAQYRQAERQEAEDNKLRAIRQYLHRAFNEPSTQEAADSNPLLRESRLTASNPLLD